MNSFELNKIMGAVLGTLLFVMGVGFIAEAIYHPIENRGVGYNLPEPEGTETAGGAEPVAAVPLSVLLASANAEAGAAVARRCQSCHNFEEGAGNRTGPELWAVVGRQIGTEPGYNYSAALAEKSAQGLDWTYEELDHFLAAPQAYAPGTRMNLAVSDAEDRADLLAYLQTLSDSPVAFPEPEEVAEPEEAPEAEGEALEGGAVPVPTDDAVDEPVEPGPPAEVVDTPTTTQTETQVEGTPTTSAPASEAPAEQAPAEAAPEAEPAPADETPVAPANTMAPANVIAPANQMAPASGS